MYSNDVILKVKCVFNRIIAEVSTQYFFYGILGKSTGFLITIGNQKVVQITLCSQIALFGEAFIQNADQV